MEAPAPGGSDVRLIVPSAADDVMLVRQLLAGVAEATALGEAALNDVSTAVTEACNNVVIHAYPGGTSGEMTVDVGVDSGLTVTVADAGRGIGPVPGVRTTGDGGLGIPVMLALANVVEYRAAETSGTVVRMAFDVHPASVDHAPPPRERPAAWDAKLPPPGARLGVYSRACAPPVCRRLLAAFAARARLAAADFGELARIATGLGSLPDVELQLAARPGEVLVAIGGEAVPELGPLTRLSATLADGTLRIRQL